MKNNENSDDDLHDIIIRTSDYKRLPDIVGYVKSLHSKDYFKNLIKTGKFELNELKKLPISKFCDIFFRDENHVVQNCDIIVFKHSGNFQLYMYIGKYK